MMIALAINLAMLAAAAVGGVLTGSLALLADAGHVLSDVGAILLALLAAALAARSGGPRRTFGYQRTEVIAALVNGVALVAIAVLVVVAAINRLGDPPSVEGAGVIALGVVEVLGNGAATWVLARGRRDDLNLEAVLRHSAVDALGSLAVVVSGTVILATGWDAIDPLASIVIAILILASSIRLVREPLDVLMEAAPSGTDVDAIARAVGSVPGVREVHELHVWTVTPGFETLAAHVVVARGEDRDRARREVEFLLRDRYGVEHTTLQMEEEADDAALLQVQTEPRRDLGRNS
jgi:cobalt-zinc-cadmium efflux system protein